MVYFQGKKVIKIKKHDGMLIAFKNNHFYYPINQKTKDKRGYASSSSSYGGGSSGGYGSSSGGHSSGYGSGSGGAAAIAQQAAHQAKAAQNAQPAAAAQVTISRLFMLMQN